MKKPQIPDKNSSETKENENALITANQLLDVKLNPVSTDPKPSTSEKKPTSENTYPFGGVTDSVDRRFKKLRYDVDGVPNSRDNDDWDK